MKVAPCPDSLSTSIEKPDEGLAGGTAAGPEGRACMTPTACAVVPLTGARAGAGAVSK